MNEQNELLQKKVLGTIQAIEKMSAEERSKSPSGRFGADYNKLLLAVAGTRPELKDLLPPMVEVFQSMVMGELTHQSFSEILTYYSQIYQLLS